MLIIICRLELDEVVSFADESPHSHSRLAEIRKKSHYDRRHSHEHRHHHRKHHYDHVQRRHSHHHHHGHHHPSRKNLEHHHSSAECRKSLHPEQQHHHHHSSTDFDSDTSPGRRRRALRKLHLERPQQQEIVITDSSQERVSEYSPTSTNSLDKVKAQHSKNGNNMRININNVNILINRHLHNDVTINIDMDETEEAEVVTISGEQGGPDHQDHDHSHEVRSNDSGIGWDDHHHDHHHDVHDGDHHDISVTTAEIEPSKHANVYQVTFICNLSVEEEQERSVIVEAEDARKDHFVAKLKETISPINIPKRPRHNTFT